MQWGLPFLSPRPDPRCGPHWWQRASIDSWGAAGSVWAVFHGGSPASPALPTSTVPLPVFPSVPSLRLRIPTSSGHGIHSARKVKAVGCGVTAVRAGSCERCCRSTGRQQGCSSNSTGSIFPLCSAHVQQRQLR